MGMKTGRLIESVAARKCVGSTSAARAGECCDAQPVTSAQIPVALSSLTANVGYLNQAIRSLMDRVSPVMRTTGDGRCGEALKAADSGECELAASIRTVSESVDECRSLVEDMLNRVEV